MTIKTTLRKQLNQTRNKLNISDKTKFSEQICKKILSHFNFPKLSAIASYHALGNEVDLAELYHYSNALYLPVIQNYKTMQFKLYESKENLKQNHYGIYEPHNTKLIELTDLELCLVPLVGFNRKGNRLGMGGGYYDRYFELNKFQLKPTILAGIAYDFQEDATIQSDPWDIPLDFIITNREIIIPNSR